MAVGGRNRLMTLDARHGPVPAGQERPARGHPPGQRGPRQRRRPRDRGRGADPRVGARAPAAPGGPGVLRPPVRRAARPGRDQRHELAPAWAARSRRRRRADPGRRPAEPRVGRRADRRVLDGAPRSRRRPAGLPAARPGRALADGGLQRLAGGSPPGACPGRHRHRRRAADAAVPSGPRPCEGGPVWHTRPVPGAQEASWRRPACRPIRRSTATRLAEQSDEQIDAWAAELMRDVAIRRGVVRVIADFRSAAGLGETEFERVFASGGGPPAVVGRDRDGRLMVPAITLFALVPGIRSQVADGRSPPDRVPRRELRRARLRLTAPSHGWGASLAGSRLPGPSLAVRVAAVLRLTHPFPSLLDGLATWALALVAGAGTGDALRLGVAMTLLQAGIGTVNDLVDAAADAGRQARQADPERARSPEGSRSRSPSARSPSGWRCPRPRGRGRRRSGWPGHRRSAWPTTCGSRGPPGRGCRSPSGSRSCRSSPGLARRGRCPAPSRVLLPAAVAAGAALAIGNARADLERDRRRGRRVDRDGPGLVRLVGGPGGAVRGDRRGRGGVARRPGRATRPGRAGGAGLAHPARRNAPLARPLAGRSRARVGGRGRRRGDPRGRLALGCIGITTAASGAPTP